MVICIALYTSAQIGKTVLLKRTVSDFFMFPKDVKKRKSWVNDVIEGAMQEFPINFKDF